MRRFHVIPLCLLSAALAAALGCKNGPGTGLAQHGAAGTAGTAVAANGTATSPAVASNIAQAQQALSAQLQDLNRRISQLDANNRDLHSQLAQTEQSRLQFQEQAKLLREQLEQTTKKISDHQTARVEAEKKLEATLASTRIRGGATINSNNNLKQALSAVQIPGLEVRQEGDVVRIELPADRLFTGGGTTLSTEGARSLDDVAAAIARSYPRQRIVIEGHTDNSQQSNQWAAHAQTATQAGAVLQHLVTQGHIRPAQLSLQGVGSNHPKASNATPEGQAQNRRVQIVVYPDTFDGS